MGLSYTFIKDTLLLFINIINSAFQNLFTVLGSSDWFDKILKDDLIQKPMDAIKGVAITLCVLFFLIDFFRKTMDLQWIKWENVLMLFVKVILTKVCVDNVEVICSAIYNGFSSIVTTAGMGTATLIPQEKYDAGSFFFLTEAEVDKIYAGGSAGFFDFSPILLSAKINVMAILLDIILYICLAIVYGRMFELVVYTVIAPIPIASLACDGFQDIGKGFLKSYAAVCIQAIVLMVMLSAFSVINTNIGEGAIPGILKVLALALGVMQSGAWAKRICGAM